MYLHLVLFQVKRYVRSVNEVVRKVLLDYVAFVAEAHDEVAKAIMRIVLHDVP